MGVLKLDGSGLPEVRLIYMYAKLKAPSLVGGRLHSSSHKDASLQDGKYTPHSNSL
jgi:hypothetical protein